MLAQILAEAGITQAQTILPRTASLRLRQATRVLLIRSRADLIRQLQYASGLVRPSTCSDPGGPKRCGGMEAGLAFAASKTNRPDNKPACADRAIQISPRQVPVYLFSLGNRIRQSSSKGGRRRPYYHHFLDAFRGQVFRNQEWQARQRLILLEKKP